MFQPHEMSGAESPASELLITSEGFERLRSELRNLETARRQHVAEQLREARSAGDPEDNPEYDDAKAAQGLLEARIAQLRQVIGEAIIADLANRNPDEAGFGSSVTLWDEETDDEWEVVLVGSYEAEPDDDRISISCPLGQALLGRRSGDRVHVETPDGPRQYEILRVE